MQDQRVDISSVDGVPVPAIFHGPLDEKNVDLCVLLLHGLTTGKNEYQDVYKNLASDLGARSVCSLRIDFRGHGESTAPLADYSVHTQVLDTISSLSYIRNRFPAARIRILGTSYGAPPAIVSSAIDQAIEKVVLLAPILDFDRTFLHPTTPWASENFGISRYQTALSKGMDIGDGFTPGPRLFLDHFIISPIDHLRAISSRCTILHGDQDGMVPFDVSAEAAIAHSEITFHRLKNTGHGLAEVGDESRSSDQTLENQSLLQMELAD